MNEHEVDPAEHLTMYPATAGDEWHQHRWATGVEAPWDAHLVDALRTVVRTFCFIDLCRSTAYLEEYGPIAATAAVSDFRNRVRSVAARRGVRVAKWLGDGAMLVGVSSAPVIATAAELVIAAPSPAVLPARAGVSVSHALLLDGDDYLARGANFAARICDLAEPDEVLCDLDCIDGIPTWIQVAHTRALDVRGMGAYTVASLQIE